MMGVGCCWCAEVVMYFENEGDDNLGFEGRKIVINGKVV